MNAFKILADAMNYLDQRYCRGSILQWIGNSPEGRAYVILRRLFAELLEEPTRMHGVARMAIGNARSVPDGLRLTGFELPASAADPQ